MGFKQAKIFNKFIKVFPKYEDKYHILGPLIYYMDSCGADWNKCMEIDIENNEGIGSKDFVKFFPDICKFAAFVAGKERWDFSAEKQKNIKLGEKYTADFLKFYLSLQGKTIIANKNVIKVPTLSKKKNDEYKQIIEKFGAKENYTLKNSYFLGEGNLSRKKTRPRKI